MIIRTPRYAFVIWPDQHDKELPCCIAIDGIDYARRRGALLIGCEWEWLPTEDVADPAQSNPRRAADEDGS